MSAKDGKPPRGTIDDTVIAAGLDPNELEREPIRATDRVDIRLALEAIAELGPNPNPLDLGEPVRQLAVAARALNELDGETVRLAALGILRETCGMVKAFADHLLKQAWREAAGPEKAAKAKEKEKQALYRAAQKMAGQGGIANLDDPPVAEDPVSGQLLIEEFIRVAQRFLVVPAPTLWTMALWALATYVYDSFEVFAYCTFSSPVKRCGKTTAKKLMGAFVRRPQMASHVSPAVIFRIIEAYRPTLLLDEVDALLASKDDDIRGMLNAGHERSGVVLRCEGDSLEPRAFSTFSPKVLALIGRLPDTLLDRSIVIHMKRRKKGEARERLTRAPYQAILSDGEIWRGKALRWAQDHRDDLQTLAPRMPETLGDREMDNWEPLFAVAQTLGGEWSARVTEAAKALAGGDEDESQELSVLLLADVKAVWEPAEEKMPTATLLEKLRDLEDRAWPSYGKSGKGLSARDLSFLLGKYDIRPKVIRWGDHTPRGYERADFADAWGRYVEENAQTPRFDASHPQHTQHTNENSDLSQASQLQQGDGVADQESDLSARNNRPVAGVADASPENEGPVSSPPPEGEGQADAPSPQAEPEKSLPPGVVKIDPDPLPDRDWNLPSYRPKPGDRQWQ